MFCFLTEKLYLSKPDYLIAVAECGCVQHNIGAIRAVKKVAIFVSEDAGCAEAILERQAVLESSTGSLYKVVVIFTNKKDSGAFDVACRHGIPAELHDIDRFCAEYGTLPGDLSARPAYFRIVMNALERYSVDIVCLVNYGLIVTEPLLSGYRNRILSLHHGDLSIRNRNGKAIYAGKDAISNALLSGMKEIRSTVHIVTEELDQGAPIIVSGPVEVELPGGISLEEVRGTEALGRLSEQHREALRKMDSVIYPMALELMSSGRVYVDENGSACADENALSAIKSMGMKTCGVKAYLPQVVEDG